MKTLDTSYTVADLCNAMDRKEIKINRDYQRNSRVWPVAARSFLIETILLGYPVPKLSLFQKTDIKTRQTIKEIVDGQQRSGTIYDFFHNKFRLARTLELEEARGKFYKDLDEDLQQNFLEFSLSVDLFVSATPGQIREAFRRINSYNVPLNAEEQRHAVYQGEFKWFMYSLARNYSTNLRDIGVFKESQLIRMQDVKLFCEVFHSLAYGIRTTKKNDLERLYKDYDAEGSLEDSALLKSYFNAAVNQVISFEEIHHGGLMKPHVVYSLLLAIMHVKFDIETLRDVYRVDNKVPRNELEILARLSSLAESISGDDDEVEVPEMNWACAGGTNVKDKREARFKLICDALVS